MGEKIVHLKHTWEILNKAGVVELEVEIKELCEKLARNHKWMESVEDRDEDPDYTAEQFQKEDEKYERLLEENTELEEKIESKQKEFDEKVKKVCPEYGEIMV